MTAPSGQRGPRPNVTRFESGALVARWSELASRKRPGFQWDGSTYAALGRSLTPNIGSLERHRDALEGLIEVAPTAFPSQPALKGSLLALHLKHNIFEGAHDAKAQKLATDGADAWRIMCRHLYELKKQGCEIAGLQPLLDKIILPTEFKKKVVFDDEV